MQQLHLNQSQPLVRKKRENKLLYLLPLVFLGLSFGLGKVFFKPKIVAVEPEPTDALEEVVADESLIQVDASMPRTEICPLNGAKYTAPEREAWATRRPLAVMIENSQEARPQSGLSKADVVFEAVAEGGITRFMALYYCDAQKVDVLLAPIRSARVYYIALASGFNRPMYVHVGGANAESTPETNALAQLGTFGWNSQNDINQFSVGYPTFIRDYNRIPGVEVATEHTMTTTTEKLWTVAAKRGWTNMSPDTVVNKKTVPGADWQTGYDGWSFADGASQATSQTVSYDFWSMSGFSVAWNYDAASNSYTRSNGGQAQNDLNTGKPLAFTNVVVLLVNERGPLNEEKHMLYDVVGKGNGYLFANGVAKEIKWSKASREAELEFNDATGKAVELARGKIWVSIVPDDNKISY
jgi:hypothetical protein